LLALHLLVRARARATALRAFWLGVALGVALLARIDTCFLAAILGIALLWRRRFADAVAAAVGGACVVLPWWMYCWLEVGAILPESGLAVRQIAASHGSGPWAVFAIVALSQMAIAQLVPVFRFDTAANMALGGVIFALAAFNVKPRLWPVTAATLPLLCMMAAGVSQFVFYTSYEHAFWFFSRYFNFLLLCIIIVFSLWVGPRLFKPDGALRMRAAAIAACLAAAALGPGLFVLVSRPGGTPYSGSAGAKGYREAALELLPHVAAPARLGALQSGALTYYAPAGVRVINLDGVVNAAAYRAVRDHRLDLYVKAMGIDYFADWIFNAGELRRSFGVNPDGAPMKLVATAAPQGIDHMSLYTLDLSHYDR
jgi:hypothetical protein